MIVVTKKALWTGSPCVLKVEELVMDWKSLSSQGN